MMDVMPLEAAVSTAFVRPYRSNNGSPVFPPTTSELMKSLLPYGNDVATSPRAFTGKRCLVLVSGEEGQQLFMPKVVKVDGATVENAYSIKSNLNSIKDQLSLSVTQLAELFNVTRKAVYDWYEDAEPRPAVAARIRALYDALAYLNSKEEAQRLKFVWKIPVSGKSFLETLSNEALDEFHLRQALIDKLNELSPKLATPNRALPRMSVDIGRAHLAEIDRSGDFS